MGGYLASWVGPLDSTHRHQFGIFTERRVTHSEEDGSKGLERRRITLGVFLYKGVAIDSHSHNGSSFVGSERRKFTGHEIL